MLSLYTPDRIQDLFKILKPETAKPALQNPNKKYPRVVSCNYQTLISLKKKRRGQGSMTD